MTRLRHAVDFLVSVGLLASALVTGVTGLISDLWDLNDFWYHTVSGYVMGGFAIAHVVLNWNRLVSYGGFRLHTIRSGGERPGPTPKLHPRRPPDEVEPQQPAASLARAVLSRRGLFGLTIGAVGGLALGRGLRPPPQIEAGSDVGVVYHRALGGEETVGFAWPVVLAFLRLTTHPAVFAQPAWSADLGRRKRFVGGRAG